MSIILYDPVTDELSEWQCSNIFIGGLATFIDINLTRQLFYGLHDLEFVGYL